MSEPTAIFAPLNNVNDESILVVEIRHKDGDFVSKDAVLLVAETSKATFEIQAPHDGYVRYLAKVQQDVPIGAPLCLLAESSEQVWQAAPPVPKGAGIATEDAGHAEENFPPTAAPQPVPARQEIAAEATAQIAGASAGRRLSKRAWELLKQHSVDAAAITGTGLLRGADVRRCLGMAAADQPEGKPSPAAGPARATAAASLVCDHVVEGVARHEQKLPHSKRTEISILATAHASAITSQVSTLVPCQRIFELCSQKTEFSGEMSSRIIFETSRLLRRYPMLNAGYRAGHIVYYDEINIGYAIDVDHGLKVPVFPRADEMTLEQIHEYKRDLLEKYLLNALSLDHLARGTFTMTDLSAQDGWIFNPIINKGQAAILGVTGEQQLAAGQFAFGLVLAFDHRLTDGLAASRFLAELKRRLLAHEALLLRRMGVADEGNREPYCEECLQPVSEIKRRRNHLFKTVTADGRERLVCSVCAGGY